MTPRSCIVTKPTLCPTLGHCAMGQYPQTVAVPQAVAAMSPTPDEDGYYHSAFDGQRYARLVVADNAEGTLSDGSELVAGEVRYFLVEPILWWTVPLSSRCRLLVCHHVLMAHPFGTEDNQWQTSTVRAMLQQWVVQVFRGEEQRCILDVPLDNNSAGCVACYGGRTLRLDEETMPWCHQSPTHDGVFLLSKPEYDDLRQGGLSPMDATDYAKAQGAYATWEGVATGWLRSAECCRDRAFIFGIEDSDSAILGISTGRRVDEVMGVAPVVCVRDK